MRPEVQEGINELEALADGLPDGAPAVWLAMAALADPYGRVELDDYELGERLKIRPQPLLRILRALQHFGLVTPAHKGYQLWPWLVTVEEEEGEEEGATERVPENLPRWLPKRVFARLPSWIPGNLWLEWELHRNQLGRRLTDATRDRQWRELEKFRRKGGVEYALMAIEQSLERGWRGLFEPKERLVREKKRPTIPVPSELGRREILVYQGEPNGEGDLYPTTVADLEGGYLRIVEEGDPIRVRVEVLEEPPAEEPAGNLVDALGGLLGSLVEE